MRIDAIDYFTAAKERLAEANLLYEKERYALAIYVAGVAVESLLRAYIVRINPKFEAAHDLYLLLDASNLRSFSAPTEGQQAFAAITTLFRRWRNDLRYTSNARLRRRLKKAKLDRGIRGDFLKANCRMVIEAAKLVLKIGVTTWKTS